MTQQENEKAENISLPGGGGGAGGTGPGGGGTPGGPEPPGGSPFDFPGMGGAGQNPPDPTLDLLGQGGLGVVTSLSQPNPAMSMQSQRPPAPNSMNAMGVGPPQSGPMSQPNPAMTKPPTTKSHLAEILGSHEMHQLQTMSRTLDNCPPNSMSQSRPNNPGMTHMTHQMNDSSMTN